MNIICLHNKEIIKSFLINESYLQIYSIGDLDDFFWPYTTWYALEIDNIIVAIAMLYTGLPLPTLLAINETNPDSMKYLLSSISHILPYRFYAHLSSYLVKTLKSSFNVESHGISYKMGLMDKSKPEEIETSSVFTLSRTDLEGISNLYKISYPSNWFDPRMLESNKYFGVKRKKQLISVAGIHVYSQKYSVAALANITTHPNHRNNGHARAVTAKLCVSLLEDGVKYIGLNVHTQNKAAIKCYERLGFKEVGSYEECMVEK